MKKLALLVCFIIVGILAAFFVSRKANQKSVNEFSQSSLQVIANVPLNGGANRLDYQSIDPESKRLFIAHLGSNIVHVYDIQQKKIIKDISNIPSPHGILAVPQLNSVYVSTSGQNKVVVINENALTVIKTIDVGDTPDGIAFDPHTNKIFVSNENGGSVTVIDGKTNTRIEDIKFGSSIGNTQYDPISKHVYTADGGENKLVEIDPTTDKAINVYNMPNCKNPHGFYIDENTHYALVTCNGNNRMDVFDLESKKVIAADTTGDGPDILAFDNGLHRLYVSAESGVVTVFTVEKNSIKKLSQAFIAPHAHTIAVNQENHQVFLPLENLNGKPVLRILEPKN